MEKKESHSVQKPLTFSQQKINVFENVLAKTVKFVINELIKLTML